MIDRAELLPTSSTMLANLSTGCWNFSAAPIGSDAWKSPKSTTIARRWRELEALPAINKVLGTVQAQRNQRLRQAIGVLVRMIMERRGWKKTGKKGSLGVRSSKSPGRPSHNTGGLAFWFVRAERYVQEQGKSFPSVRKRCRELESGAPKPRTRANGHAGNGRTTKSTSPIRRSTKRRPGAS